MALKFCEKCNALMNPEKKEGLTIFKCPSCGFIESIEDFESVEIKDKMIHPEPRGRGVGSDKNNFANYPNVCKKCGYGFAQILDLGIFYSDEDNLILLKCGKCGFSERVGRKVS